MPDGEPLDRRRGQGLAAILAVLVLATTLLSVSALGLAVWASTRTVDTVRAQQEGRREAIAVMCGGLSAVSAAGRAIIIGGDDQFSHEFRRNLERLGYPPRKTQAEASRRAAAAYSNAIADGIERQSGARKVVRPDGTLDCDRVQQISRTR